MQGKVEYSPCIEFVLFNFLFLHKEQRWGAQLQLFSWGEQTEQVIFRWFPGGSSFPKIMRAITAPLITPTQHDSSLTRSANLQPAPVNQQPLGAWCLRASEGEPKAPSPRAGQLRVTDWPPSHGGGDVPPQSWKEEFLSARQKAAI